MLQLMCRWLRNYNVDHITSKFDIILWHYIFVDNYPPLQLSYGEVILLELMCRWLRNVINQILLENLSFFPTKFWKMTEISICNHKTGKNDIFRIQSLYLVSTTIDQSRTDCETVVLKNCYSLKGYVIYTPKCRVR